MAFGKKYTVHDGGGRQGVGESADVEAGRRRDAANAAAIAKVAAKRRKAQIEQQKAEAAAKAAKKIAKRKGK